MSGLLAEKLAVLAKIETTPGTDAVPTGSANALVLSDVKITPYEGREDPRNIVAPWLGNMGAKFSGTFVRLEASFELAGPGAAGPAPAWGPLVRACGFGQTIDIGVDVEYAPVSGAFEAVSVYYTEDGVRHIMLGARGNLMLSLAATRIPRGKVNLVGQLGTISDTALPTVDFTSWVEGLPVSDDNTTFSLDSVSAHLHSLEIDAGVKVQPRFLVGYEGMDITGRSATGSAVIDKPTIATKNWFSALGNKVALALTHGTAAGNIVQLAAPKAQLGRPTAGVAEGVSTLSIPLGLTPNAGNDELVITAK